MEVSNIRIIEIGYFRSRMTRRHTVCVGNAISESMQYNYSYLLD